MLVRKSFYNSALAASAFAAALLFAFALCGCSSSDDEKNDGGDSDLQEQETELVNKLPFEPAGPNSTPDPMLKGPFPVGVKTLEFDDPSRITKRTNKPRHLKVEIWYPAEQKYKDGPFDPIDFKAQALLADLGDKRAKVEASTIPAIDTNSKRDADMDREHGPYPVLEFSHGAFGIRWQSVFFTEHMASHGYIVVAIDHEENTLWDIIRDGYNPIAVSDSGIKRPTDVSFVLDRLAELNAKDGDFFFKSMNMNKIAASGHSLGGWTSIATPCSDGRILASVAHSPAIAPAEILSGCDFRTFPVPLLVQGGTKDKTLSWKGQYCDYRPVTPINDFPKYMQELVGGGHYTFSDICLLDLEKLAKEIDFGDAEDALTDGCSPTDNVPYDRAHQTINYYAAAFLNHYLRDDAKSLEYMVDKDDPPFQEVNFYVGQVPDWPDGGCE